MTADLVQRLRSHSCDVNEYGYPIKPTVCREAADAIDSLTASADIWEKRCMDSEARLAAAEAEAYARGLRTALSERVVEAIKANASVFEIASALADYEKAYSVDPKTVRMCGKSGGDICEICVGSCGIEEVWEAEKATDLNSAKEGNDGGTA